MAEQTLTLFSLSTLILLYFSTMINPLNRYLTLIGLTMAICQISWAIAKFFRRFFHLTHVSPANKAILITGCDSGIGFAAAKALDTFGFHVFAGCKDVRGHGAQTLFKSSSQRLRIVGLDVTKPEEVADVVFEIIECDLTLWAVINNAAIADVGHIEWGENIFRIRQLLEVNLFGVINVTKACLPLIRQSKGRIVNIGGLLGRVTFPSMGPYCMSKHALRSYTDSLRNELSPFNVKVINIEPFMYSTDLIDSNRLICELEKCWKYTNKDIRDFYGDKTKTEIGKKVHQLSTLAKNDLSPVIAAIEQSVTSASPETNYKCCDNGERIVIWLLEHLPEPLIDFFFSRSVNDIKAYVGPFMSLLPQGKSKKIRD